jgi:hypothetical protein
LCTWAQPTTGLGLLGSRRPSPPSMWPNAMETGDDARPRWRWRRWGIPTSWHRRWVGNRSCGKVAVWWIGLMRERGQRGDHQSCPRRCLWLTGERRRKHGPGVEGANDWAGELRGAAPELRDGSAGGSEGSGRRCTVVPHWRHGGAVGGGGLRKEKGSFTGLGSLYSG